MHQLNGHNMTTNLFDHTTIELEWLLVVLSLWCRHLTNEHDSIKSQVGRERERELGGLSFQSYL